MIFLAGSTHIGAVHTFRNICVETPDYLQVGQAFGVDPTAAEEMCSTAALQVAVQNTGRVCGITKRRQQALDPSMLMVSPADIDQRS